MAESSYRKVNSDQMAESSDRKVNSDQMAESSDRKVNSDQMAESSDRKVNSDQMAESSDRKVNSDQMAESSDRKVNSDQTAESSDRKVNTLVFLDLESTGLGGNGAKPKITEVSLVAVHRSLLRGSAGSSPMRVVDKLTLCVHPMKPIGHVASQITGLYNDDLSYQKDFDPGLVELLETFLRRHEPPICLIAHNGCTFDFPLLKSEIMAVECDFRSNILCADSLAMIRELDEIENELSCPELVKTETPGSMQSSHKQPKSLSAVKRKLQFHSGEKTGWNVGQEQAVVENGTSIVKSPRIETPAPVEMVICETRDASSEKCSSGCEGRACAGCIEHKGGTASKGTTAATASWRPASTATVCAQSDLDGKNLLENSSVPDSLLIEAEALFGESETQGAPAEAKAGSSKALSGATGTGSRDTAGIAPVEHSDKSCENHVPHTALPDGATGGDFQRPPPVSRVRDGDWSRRRVTPQNGRKSYRLGAVYERVVGQPMADAHRAENDCLALLRICQVLSEDVCKWLDRHAQPWSTVEPMYPQSPRKRPPLSPGHFPYHDDSP